jgi:hypothetical protein
MHYNTRVLSDSIKFYLPRTEGYLEIIREPTKYMLVGVHVNDIKEEDLISFANKIRIMFKQKNLAFELNNRLILAEDS